MSKIIIGSRDESSIPFVLCEATDTGYKLFQTESHKLKDEPPAASAASAASAVGSHSQDSDSFDDLESDYLFRRLITKLDCPEKKEGESEEDFLARISEEWGVLRQRYSLTSSEQH